MTKFLKLMKFFLFSTLVANQEGLHEVIVVPKDLDWTIKYPDSDFFRNGYREDVYMFGSKDQQLSWKVSNNIERFYLAQARLAKNLGFESGYDYHLVNYFGGGESAMMIQDHALKPTQQIFNQVKHLINYDYLEPEREALPPVFEELQKRENSSGKIIQFKVSIDFEINVLKETLKFKKQFTPRYSFDTATLVNDETYLLNENHETLLGIEYQPRLVFEKTLAVHEKKTYQNCSLTGPGVMPKLWIEGNYQHAFLDKLNASIPPNNDIFSTQTITVSEMSLFSPVKVLDFENNQQIVINTTFNPFHTNQQLDPKDIYHQVEIFIAKHYQANDPITLFYENLLLYNFFSFNPFNSETILEIPISYQEDLNSKIKYEKVVGQPKVIIKIQKTMNLEETNFPSSLDCVDHDDLESQVRELLQKNYLLKEEVHLEYFDGYLRIAGTNEKIKGERILNFSFYPIDPEIPVDPEKPINPKEPVNPETPPDDKKENNQLETSSKMNKKKLLWLILPGIILLVLIVLLSILLLKKKKKHKMVK